MKWIIRLLILLVAALLLSVYAPWLSVERAEERVIGDFNAAWQGVIDGCGFNCSGCGIKNVSRRIIGYNVEIEYACGLIPEDTPEYHLTDIVYVSPLGTVHGLDTP